MSVKLLINGVAGSGKTDLLSSLGEETFVISRDAKEFSLPLPHILIEEYTDMDTFVDCIVTGMESYNEKMGKYPKIVAIDSVSQIFMDVIDVASQKPNNYGSQGAEVTKEMATLTKFIHESLELSGITVILLNHVIPVVSEGELTGEYVSFGQGKFLSKGGFYATTNESILVTVKGNNRKVTTRDNSKLARTYLRNLPQEMWVENTVHPEKSKKLKEDEEYFNLKNHIQKLYDNQLDLSKWSL